MMTRQEIRTLHIFRALEDNSHISQRELARKTELSLGLVNTFIKRLAKKGYIKLRNINAKNLRYVLTVAGVSEKARLSIAYIQYSLQYYKETRTMLCDLGERLVAENVKRVLLCGAGELAEIAYISFQNVGIDVVGICDTHDAGRVFIDQLPIQPLSAIGSISCDRIVISKKLDTDETAQLTRLLAKGKFEAEPIHLA